MDLNTSFKRWKNRKIYREKAHELDFLKSLAKLGSINFNKVFENLPNSKSDIFQEIFVLSMLNFKKQGYFVEFGAADGIIASNTYLLENQFGWDGILAEPARCWQNDLKKNRESNIDFDCVWHTSNEQLLFLELQSWPVGSGLASTLKKRKKFLKKHIGKEKEYLVKTISLNDLLERYNAPPQIDYLSIDTEGSELDILRNLDFEKYNFSVITIETHHNFDKEEKFDFLISKGYKRVMEDVSQIDDWFIQC